MAGIVDKKFQGLFAGHLQHVGDGLALVMDFQGFAVVALAVADFAGHVNVGQEMHFYLDNAVAGTVSQRPPLTLKLKRPGP